MLRIGVAVRRPSSDGERAGYLQKFSRKGWICKTYEGELAMTTMPGVAPTIWSFSVRDDSVAGRIRDAIEAYGLTAHDLGLANGRGGPRR